MTPQNSHFGEITARNAIVGNQFSGPTNLNFHAPPGE